MTSRLRVSIQNRRPRSPIVRARAAVGQQLREAIRQRELVLDGDEHPARPGELGDPADGRADERAAEAHRLRQDHRHSLCPRGQRDHAGLAQDPAHLERVRPRRAPPGALRRGA